MYTFLHVCIFKWLYWQREQRMRSAFPLCAHSASPCVCVFGMCTAVVLRLTLVSSCAAVHWEIPLWRKSMGLFVMNNLRHYTVQWPLLQIIQAYTHQCKKQTKNIKLYLHFKFLHKMGYALAFIGSQRLDMWLTGEAAIKLDLLNISNAVFKMHIEKL